MPSTRHSGGLLALVFMGALLVPAMASAGEEGSVLGDLALEVDLDIQSKYVWRGIAVVDDFVLQPAVDLSLGGFGVNVWGNMDLTDENDDAGEFTEVDLTGSYSFSLDSFDFSIGVVAYLFPTVDGDTVEVFASVGYDTLLSPTLTVYQDIDEVDGTYVTLSGSYTLEDPFDLGDAIGLSPEFAISVGFGSRDHNEFYYGDRDAGFADLTVGISVPYRLCENATLAGSMHYSTLLTDDIRDLTDDEDNLWFGLSLAVTF